MITTAAEESLRKDLKTLMQSNPEAVIEALLLLNRTKRTLKRALDMALEGLEMAGVPTQHIRHVLDTI